MNSRRGIAVPWLCSCLLLLGCEALDPTGDGEAFLSIQASALSSADVARVRVTATSATSQTLAIDLVRSANGWGGTLSKMRVGSWTFAAKAFDSAGSVLYRGEVAGVAILKNQQALVALVLQ